MISRLAKLADNTGFKIARGTFTAGFLLANTPQVFGDDSTKATNIVVEDTRCTTDKILLKPDNFSNISDLVIGMIETNYKECFSAEQKDLIKYILSSEVFQKGLETLRIEKEWSVHNISKALIFAFIYLLAYMPTLIALWKREIKIRKKSFAGFAFASGGAAAITGFVPGASVLAETFLLATTAILLDTKNTHGGMIAVSGNLLYEVNFGKLPTEVKSILEPIKIDEDDERYKPYSYDPEAIEKEKEYRILRFMANNLSKAGVCFSKFDENGKPVIWNDALAKISGYKYKEILETWENAPYLEKKFVIMKLLYKGEDYDRVIEYLSKVDEIGGYDNVMFTMTTKEGKIVNLFWTTMPDNIGGTSRIAIPENAEEESFRQMLDDLPTPVSKYNENGKPIVWNKALEKITGYSYKEILETWENAPDGEKSEAIMKLLYKGENYNKVKSFVENVDTSGGYTQAFTMNTKDGREVTLLWTTIPDGKGGTLRNAREIWDLEKDQRLKDTEDKLKKAIDRAELLREHLELLKQEAYIDGKTGLLNRKGFDAFLKNYDGTNFALVFLDLDYFKKANDNGGHDFGDITLRMFGFFLRNILRSSDVVVRSGGDEFHAFLDSSNDIDTGKIIDSFRNFFSSVIFLIGKDGKISAYYKGNNDNHKSIFEKFCVENDILKLNLISLDIIQNFKPGNPIVREEGKYIGFSASCGISTGNNSKEFSEVEKTADKQAYYVKNISKLKFKIEELENTGELYYDHLSNGRINLVRKSDNNILIKISSGGVIKDEDNKNGVGYFVFTENGEKEGMRIIKGDRVFEFTNYGLEFYDNVIVSDDSLGERH